MIITQLDDLDNEKHEPHAPSPETSPTPNPNIPPHPIPVPMVIMPQTPYSSAPLEPQLQWYPTHLVNPKPVSLINLFQPPYQMDWIYLSLYQSSPTCSQPKTSRQERKMNSLSTTFVPSWTNSLHPIYLKSTKLELSSLSSLEKPANSSLKSISRTLPWTNSSAS